jgi:hypothetical protein
VTAVLVSLLAAQPMRRPSRTTPASVPATAPNPVTWETPQVKLEAADLSIDVNGAVFRATDPHVDLHSDPGDARYQTLEVTWQENDVEMRWYIYLASDGREWWATEMRTYDGAKHGDWVTFNGARFRTPVGAAFTGDLDVSAHDHGVTSRITAKGLRLSAFRH